MNEAPELRVLQPPRSQEPLLRKTPERVGADHPKVTELDTELTQRGSLTSGRPGPLLSPTPSPLCRQAQLSRSLHREASRPPVQKVPESALLLGVGSDGE